MQIVNSEEISDDELIEGCDEFESFLWEAMAGTCADLPGF